MIEVFDLECGDTPLLVSIPHDGRELSAGQARRMTGAGRSLPDTDWHVRKLYGFVQDLGASVIAANFSRYVIDLNRPADDEALYAGRLSTGLCPAATFAGDAIYKHGAEVSAEEQAQRVEQYWQPYHDRLQQELDAIRERFGYALLWDAHSIAGEVPSLFDGTLPDLNVGSHGGRSCDASIVHAACGVAEESAYSSVLDGRFRGGYITRHYGDPRRGIHALQLELAQRTYMDEISLAYDAVRAAVLADTLGKMLMEFTVSAAAGA